ncbi:uncharacterized protein RCH09_000738 [Actimicrobium sp. GrIS 1.19]|uniref:PP0621 family protein n=1 Tax=Actimicrobium sp. GrIS 1.19 TaxID=3071708 RepID=UPI002DF97B43|nr:uncharacterized protein [Actimicrobium sp. GrIS 1.19]
MKALLWLGLIVTVIYLLRKKSRAVFSREAMDIPPRRSADGEAMVQCAECGIHVPASEAVAGAGALMFCCPEHRALHRPS